MLSMSSKHQSKEKTTVGPSSASAYRDPHYWLPQLNFILLSYLIESLSISFFIYRFRCVYTGMSGSQMRNTMSGWKITLTFVTSFKLMFHLVPLYILFPLFLSCVYVVVWVEYIYKCFWKLRKQSRCCFWWFHGNFCLRERNVLFSWFGLKLSGVVDLHEWGVFQWCWIKFLGYP